jgi:hypothetical protein
LVSFESPPHVRRLFEDYERFAAGTLKTPASFPSCIQFCSELFVGITDQSLDDMAIFLHSWPGSFPNIPLLFHPTPKPHSRRLTIA